VNKNKFKTFNWFCVYLKLVKIIKDGMKDISEAKLANSSQDKSKRFGFVDHQQ
jgi:hypothetical protein